MTAEEAAIVGYQLKSPEARKRMMAGHQSPFSMAGRMEAAVKKAFAVQQMPIGDSWLRASSDLCVLCYDDEVL